MSGAIGTLQDYGWRRILFSILVLVPLAIWAGLAQGWRQQIFLITSWFGISGPLPPEFLEIGHRLHEVAFAVVFWPILVGLLIQLRWPKRYLAGIYMALIGLVSILLAFALTSFWDPAIILVFLGIPTVLATLLHPAGRELLSVFNTERINQVLLVLIIIAAVPMLAFAANQIGLQTGAIDPHHDHAGGGHDDEVHQAHIEFGHFTIVVGVLLGVIGLGLLASLHPPGGTIAAWVAGLMVAVYAVSGLLAPEAASNPGLLWNLAAIIWAVVFIGAAQRLEAGASVRSVLGS